MRRALLLLLVTVPMWAYQAVDPTQQKRDTPPEHQGTNNPDMSQRQPTDAGKGKAAPKNGDTTGQQPGTNNPDIAKRNAPKKKHKSGTSTASGSNPK